jgi:hypothetical protein
MVESVESLMNKPSQEACEILPHEISRRGVGNPSVSSSTAGTDEGASRLHADRDACKGSTDTPRGATRRMIATPELDKMVLRNPLRWRQVRTEPQEKQNPTPFRDGSMSGSKSLLRTNSSSSSFSEKRVCSFYLPLLKSR